MVQTLLDTDDLSEAEATLSATFSRIRLHTSGPMPARTRLRRSSAGPVVADALDFGCDLQYRMDPPPQILLCRVTSGGIEDHVPGREHKFFEPGEVGAFGIDETTPFSGRVLLGNYDQLAIERSALGRVATPAPGSNGSVRLTGSAAFSPAANKQLALGVDYVKRVAAQPDWEGNDLVTAALEEYLARLILATMPSNALLTPTAGDRRDSTSVLLRRAVAFIDDNAHRDISLADIAQVCGVSARAVQYTFRRYHGCTPTAYVRRARLHYAHLDLKASDPATATVAEIAARWGFSHAGRFSTNYRQQYGCPPSDTLRT
jgi:AraC-like DNA-binding protein